MFAEGHARRVFCWVVLAILLGYLPASPQQHRGIAVLSSPNARGTVNVGQVKACEARLSQELNPAARDLPGITVFHVSAVEATMVGSGLPVRRRLDGIVRSSYYEMWIVDEPTPEQYVVYLERILEDYFGMRLSDEERIAIQQRVLQGLPF